MDKFSHEEMKVMSPVSIGTAREGPTRDSGCIVLALKVVSCEFEGSQNWDPRKTLR